MMRCHVRSNADSLTIAYTTTETRVSVVVYARGAAAGLISMLLFYDTRLFELFKSNAFYRHLMIASNVVDQSCE